MAVSAHKCPVLALKNALPLHFFRIRFALFTFLITFAPKMKAMIFAAGLGTRLKPLTDTMPKALVPVGGKPLLQIQIERMKAAGITDIVINVHHFASQIVRFIAEHDSFGMNIMFSPELDELLDTGGGIRHAAPLIKPNTTAKDQYFLIHNVDILSNLDLSRLMALAAEPPVSEPTDKPRPLAYLLVSERRSLRYLLLNDENRLVGWFNVSTGEVRSPYPKLKVAKCRKRAFAGIHLLSTAAFSLMESKPDKFSIIDFYLDICSAVPVVGVTMPDLQLMDVGKYDVLGQAETFVRTLDL